MAGRDVLKELELELPIAEDMEIRATEAADSLASTVEMSPDKLDEVRMALIEACINAFEHSHTPDGKVVVTFAVLGDVKPTSLRITVRDHGRGFSPDRVEEPVLEKKLRDRRKRGWGLMIIRGLMDEVDIQSGGEGTTVVMSKTL